MKLDKSAKIFVAGHRGLVGSAIVRKLRSEGYGNLLLRTRAELDLSVQSDVESFFQSEKPEYVFLAAAKVGGILANNTYKADFISRNLSIALHVIESAYRTGVVKLLNLGSSCIYPKLAPQPLKEEYLLTGPLEPTNEPYAIAKIAAIKLCRYYHEQHGTNYISAMPTNIYGPHDNFNLETAHVLPALIRKFHLANLLRQGNRQAIRDDLDRYPVGFGLTGKSSDDGIDSLLQNLGIGAESVTLWGTGSPYREFLYVDELADACLFLMERHDYATIGEFVNVGTGADLRISETAELVRSATGFTGDIGYDSSKPDGTPKKLLDVNRMNSLGWRARVPLEEGIRKTYAWYLNGNL